jgi:hypothetical protein
MSGRCGSSRNVTGIIGKSGFPAGTYDGTNLNNVAIGSSHFGGMHIGMGDGSVQWLTEEISPVLLFGLASRTSRDRAGFE